MCVQKEQNGVKYSTRGRLMTSVNAKNSLGPMEHMLSCCLSALCGYLTHLLFMPVFLFASNRSTSTLLSVSTVCFGILMENKTESFEISDVLNIHVWLHMKRWTWNHNKFKLFIYFALYYTLL